MTTLQTREVRCEGLPAEIEIWLATLPAEGTALVAEGAPPLSAEEWARAKRFMSPVRRRQFVAGRLLLRSLLGRLLGVAPETVALELTPTGRPVLKAGVGAAEGTTEAAGDEKSRTGILPVSSGASPSVPGDRQDACPTFSLAHAGDLVVVAVARDGRGVGVDVECVASETDWRGVAGQFLAEAEKETLETLPEDERRVAFFTLWARKEALAKGWKHGAAAPTDEYAVAADPAQPAALLECDFDPQAPDDWALADLPLAVEGYVGAVAYERKAKG
jgi:4'-phosphopantetheinyl transferase